MARRGPQASLREQAIELLAGGDKPPEVAQALGITEEELRGWRKLRTFGDAVKKRTGQLLDEIEVCVLFRVAEQAEAGQSSQQKIFLEYQQKRREIETLKSSDRWTVGWSTAKPASAKPEETPPPDPDLDE